jgi:hypothetical protein
MNELVLDLGIVTEISINYNDPGFDCVYCGVYCGVLVVYGAGILLAFCIA